MWKAFGVVTLWAALVAAPHALSAPAPDDDPGDPYALANAPKPVTAKVPAGAFATLHFRNDVGKAYALVEARFTLDGQELPTLTNVKPGSDVTIFSGRVSPGRHVAETTLVYQGNRRGLVTYMRKYKLTVHSQEVLVVPPEQARQFTISGRENKGLRVPFDRQVGIEVRDRTSRALTN
jgi:hypothetical protein